MNCKCGAIFCYICLKIISGYDHFTDNVKCGLWNFEGTRTFMPPRVRNQVNKLL